MGGDDVNIEKGLPSARTRALNSSIEAIALTMLRLVANGERALPGETEICQRGEGYGRGSVECIKKDFVVVVVMIAVDSAYGVLTLSRFHDILSLARAFGDKTVRNHRDYIETTFHAAFFRQRERSKWAIT